MKHGPPAQLDFWQPTLQLDSDMQLFEQRDRKRRKKNEAAETGILSDEWMRFEQYGRDRALEEANEIVERERQKHRDIGMLEDQYSRRGTIDSDDQRDEGPTSETARTGKR